MKIYQVSLSSQYHDKVTFFARDMTAAKQYIAEHTIIDKDDPDECVYTHYDAEQFNLALDEYWERGSGTIRYGMNKYYVYIEELDVW